MTRHPEPDPAPGVHHREHLRLQPTRCSYLRHSLHPLPSGGRGQGETTHTPDRDGSRDFDFQTGHWRDGLELPVVGSFANGVGVFEGRQELDGRPILVRFTWSDITRNGARWEHAFSPDDGKTWEKNRVMTTTRVE